jgi:uncharacterized membrane protein
MNPAHWHLMITHIPVLGPCFGLGLLLLGIIRKSDELKRASLWVFVLAGLAAIPAYLTGAPAMKHLKILMPTMAAEPSEQHMEIAILALVGVLSLAVFSFITLVWYRKGKAPATWAMVTALVLSFLISALMAWTANLGGKVRHPEIRQAQ